MRCARAQIPKSLEAMYDAWFGSIDIDKGGTIDAQELASAIASSGLPSERKTVAAFISLMDVDNSGEVDLEEFKDFICNQMSRGNAINECTVVLPGGEVFSSLFGMWCALFGMWCASSVWSPCMPSACYLVTVLCPLRFQCALP